MQRTRLPAWKLSLLAAIFIVAANNGVFFAALLEKLPVSSLAGAAYLALIVALMTGVLFALFMIVGMGPLLKPLIAAMLIVSAALGYFTNELGVVFDLDMMRNAAETIRDANPQEATELISWSLLVRTLMFGVLPSALVLATRQPRSTVLAEFRARALCLTAGIALIAVLALPNYKYLTYFSVEHRDLRFQATPVFALMSFAKFIERRSNADRPAFHVVGADAEQRKSVAKRVVGVMVVGETARADHFSLNGYARETNPRLEHEPGVLFFDAASCGTSTAYSVPCMFSMRDRDHYSPNSAKHESNVLDILDKAGVKTVWIDNNSSCKNVCNRIDSRNLRLHVDPSSPYFSDGGYYDEVLIEQLDRYLAGTTSDLLIVLHTLGSHGPAYSRRYPDEFGIFSPSCDRKSPKECADREVANAYDNTIVYTDYILSRIIDRLKVLDDEIDSFMLYASDHGESLGENGVYLHGLPYALAPRSQTAVPMIVWLSPAFALDHGIDTGATALHPVDRLSHDNISHTLLGLFEVPTRAYHREQDIFGNKTALYTAS